MSDIPGGTPVPQPTPQGIPTPAEGQNPGPWADFLESLPEDARATADSYMRETVQPRITQLEQNQLSEGERAFWSDFKADPDKALLDLAEEVYAEDNPDARDFFETALQFAKNEGLVDDPDLAAAAAAAEPDVQELELDEAGRPVAYDPRVTEQEEDRLYEEVLTGLQTANPDLIPADWDVDTLDEVLAPYLIAAEGDEERALTSFKRTRELFGVDAAANVEALNALTDEQKAELAAATKGVPTLAGGTNPATPVEKEYKGPTGLKDAVNDFLAENRAPPTI